MLRFIKSQAYCIVSIVCPDFQYLYSFIVCRWQVTVMCFTSRRCINFKVFAKLFLILCIFSIIFKTIMACVFQYWHFFSAIENCLLRDILSLFKKEVLRQWYHLTLSHSLFMMIMLANRYENFPVHLFFHRCVHQSNHAVPGLDLSAM